MTRGFAAPRTADFNNGSSLYEGVTNSLRELDQQRIYFRGIGRDMCECRWERGVVENLHSILTFHTRREFSSHAFRTDFFVA